MIISTLKRLFCRHRWEGLPVMIEGKSYRDAGRQICSRCDKIREKRWTGPELQLWAEQEAGIIKRPDQLNERP